MSCYRQEGVGPATRTGSPPNLDKCELSDHKRRHRLTGGKVRAQARMIGGDDEECNEERERNDEDIQDKAARTLKKEKVNARWTETIRDGRRRQGTGEKETSDGRRGQRPESHGRWVTQNCDDNKTSSGNKTAGIDAK